MKVLVSNILFFFIVIACVSPNNYRLKGRALNSIIFNVLDTTSVYESSLLDETGDSTYSFIRFFSDGRVFLSDRYSHKPQEVDFNSLKSGQKAYFDVVEKGNVRIEFYINGKDGYDYYYYKVYEDSIVCYLHRTNINGGTKNKLNFVKKRKDAKLMTYEKDWYNEKKEPLW